MLEKWGFSNLNGFDIVMNLGVFFQIPGVLLDLTTYSAQPIQPSVIQRGLECHSKTTPLAVLIDPNGFHVLKKKSITFHHNFFLETIEI